MKIAIVGPGIMEIPPRGWGAVETVIHDYSTALKSLGWDTRVVNTPDHSEILALVNDFEPDFVHIHYDELAFLADKILCPHVAVTSHFGYLDQVWGQPEYQAKVHRGIVRSEKLRVFALSPSIADVYIADGKPEELVHVLPNGVQTRLFRHTATPAFPHKSICLGKIEPRKQQGLLQSLHVDVMFAGNLGDTGGRWPFDPTMPEYLGHWDRQRVHTELTEYANLVLLSDGEAHPLVVIEALSAGLGIVVSESAAANLDTTQPFISVVPNEMLTDAAYVAQTIRENRERSIALRDEIIAYSASFDWSVASARFDSAIKEIVQARPPSHKPAAPRKKVALLTIATGSYFETFYPDLRSSALELLCPDADLHIFCFTDREYESQERETLCRTPSLEWPFSTLLRYGLFSRMEEELRRFDIILYIDSDMRIERTIPTSTFDHDFFAVEHPAFRVELRSLLSPNPPSFEIDESTLAYAQRRDGATYFQGCLFGGRRGPFIYMVRKLAAQVASDLRNGEIPVWHDESYLNRFFLDHRSTVLPPNFAYPEGWQLPGGAIVTHRSKAHHEARGTAVRQLDIASLIAGSSPPSKEMYRQLYLRSHEKTQRLEERIRILENPILAARWQAKTGIRRAIAGLRKRLSPLRRMARALVAVRDRDL